LEPITHQSNDQETQSSKIPLTMTTSFRWPFLLLWTTTVVLGSNIQEATAQECVNEECINGAVNEDGCIDNHANCELWASQGKCEASKQYMGMYCQKSCGICGAGSNSTE